MGTLEDDMASAGVERVGRSVPKAPPAPINGREALDKDRLRKFDDARGVTIDLCYVLNMVERRGTVSDGDMRDIGIYLQAIAGLVAS